MATSVLNPTNLDFLSSGTTLAKFTASSNTLLFAGASGSGQAFLDGVKTPTSDNQAANKSYVDAAETRLSNLLNGISWKNSVVAASTANIAGTYTGGSTMTLANTSAALGAIDGITLSADDRVLLKDQTTAGQNGIYTVTATSGSAFTLTRTADANSNTELQSAAVFVDQGSANANAAYVQVTDSINSDLITTGLVFNKFSNVNVTAGTGISVSGAEVSISNGGVDTTQLAANSVTSAKIAANTITNADIASNTIRAAEIQANTITENELATSIAGDGLAGGGGTALSVDVTTATFEFNSGKLKVKDDAITNDMMAANAVGTTELLDSNVTTAKLADLSVTVGKLAAAVAGDGLVKDSDGLNVNPDDETIELNSSSKKVQIKDGGVDAAALASDAVTTAKILDDAVTGGKLANDITISTSGTITSTHNDGITGKKFTANSDRKLKDNLVSVSGQWATEQLEKVEPYEYVFKSDPNKKRCGVIAQDLEKYDLRHLVEEKADIKSVNYIDLIGYLVASNKDLNSRLKLLEKNSSD